MFSELWIILVFIVHLAKGDTEEKDRVAFVSVEVVCDLYNTSCKSTLQLLDKLLSTVFL